LAACGRALILVRVTAQPADHPEVKIKFDVTLVVDCEIGDFPPGLGEGITFDASSINFSEKVSGITLLVVEADD